MTYNILFGICSLGTGHVARILPLIKEYLKQGNNIYVLSEKNVIEFLKNDLAQEFPKNKNYFLFEKEKVYPKFERGKNMLTYKLNLIIDGLKMPHRIKSENKIVEEFVKKYNIDFTIGDGDYSMYSKQVPSFMFIHQIEFMFRGLFYIARKISSYFNLSIFKKYTQVFVYDINGENSLSGKLAHNWFAKKANVKYIGITSHYKKIAVEKDIDYLVIISGYLAEHKVDFYNKLIKILEKKPGKKIFIMGDYVNDYHKKLKGNIEVYSSYKGLDKHKIFNRAKMIVSRTGYTTLMDLIEFEKPAVLIPTPHQSEQEYLAQYHKNKGYFNIVDSQKKLSEKTFIINKHNTRKLYKNNFGKSENNIRDVIKSISKHL